MTKQKTPIQQALKNIISMPCRYEANSKDVWFDKEMVIQMLTHLLPAERAIIEQAYGDGLNAHRTKFCNRTDYFNQTFEQ